MRLALATDIGGGTSYSMLRTAAEAYKVVQLRGQHWSALEAFYAITLGNARALGLEDEIGTPRARHRGGHGGARRARDAGHGASHGDRRGDLAEELFVLLIMGDERAVRATYVMGEPVPRA